MYKNIYKYDDMKRREHMAVREHVGWYLWTHQLVEDVKGRGGSGYVVKKDNLVLEEWFGSN